LRVPFVDLGAQQRALAAELEPLLRGLLERTDWVLGADVERFEDEFAAYCGAAHGIGTDCGLSAIELLLRAYGIGPGDEVVTAANTFVATVLAISHTGARPVLADVDPRTYTLDPAALGRAITPRTRAVIPVHLYGQPADMDAIGALADRHGLLVIEDACQAHGARYKRKRVGSLGHAAAFSFYPGKNLGALGDGGIAVTSDAAVAESLRELRNYGQREKYDHVVKGFNRRLDTLQAAALRVKLRRLDQWNERRRRSAALYDELLAGWGVITPWTAPYAEHVWHLYVIRCQDRDALRQQLAECEVDTGIHYPVPVHLQRAYRDLGYAPGDFPVTEACAREIVSLPMYPELGADMVLGVAKAVRESLARAAAAA
jgi:dTDP-4-amino-4,6-dideoxygalactose transaminase